MKAKIIFSLVIALAMFMADARVSPASSGTSSAANLKSATSSSITAEDILNYLRGAPHYHWACCAAPIPGTSNWTAVIEDCGTATVYVSNGIIIGHQDHNGFCKNASAKHTIALGNKNCEK